MKLNSKNTIDDLKEISKFNLPFTKVKLSQCYFDAILQKSQYICVLNQDKILNNIQKIDLNLLIENFTENIELTLENPFSNYGKPFKISGFGINKRGLRMTLKLKIYVLHLIMIFINFLTI